MQVVTDCSFVILFSFSGSIPGPILFGKIIDMTCLVWQTNCRGDGACFYYDNQQMSYNLLGVGLAFNILASIFFLLALIFYRSKASDITVNVTDADNDVGAASMHTSMTTITQPPTPSTEHPQNSTIFSTAAPGTASGATLTNSDQPPGSSVDQPPSNALKDESIRL